MPDVTFAHATLANGLPVIAEIDPAAHSAAIGFFVKTGARDEASRLMGVSHFLEHMMFKGTERRTAEDVDLGFDSLGADHNAFTTSEMTAFWTHCLPEALGEAEDVLSDIMRPALREADFESERNVILEEIAMYRDHPFWELYERTMEEYYGEHPLAHRVLGTPETVSSMTPAEMRDYFLNRYSADNTVIAAAGRVDFDDLCRCLDAHCGSWITTDARRAHPEFTPTPGDFTLRSEKVNRHYTLWLCPAPAIDDDRRYAAAMLMNIFGAPEGSRLYWSLVETGLAEEAQAQHDPRDGLGNFLVYTSCSPADADRVEAATRDEAARLVASLTDDDLVRVRNRVATSATLRGELPAGRMRRLGQHWTSTGRYISLEDELAKINAVTLDDLRAVHDAFPFAPVVTGRLTPAE